MNQHVADYINYYLSQKQVEHAILLSGKWGCGKTYFIDNFIKDNANDKNKKFIKISLFGLKSTNAIDDEIFQHLHPFIGSKYARLSGNLLKSAFKIGINIDLNGDGESESKVNVDTSSLKPMDFFTNKESKNAEIIFIFDDLERTDIDVKEILGYINYLVEQSNLKTIVLANEEQLTNEHEKAYTDFKEKVIGKTFEIRHDFSQVLEHFLDSEELTEIDKSIIEDVYRKAGYENLRHIKQTIIDFNYLAKKINQDYKENPDFLSQLVYVFFAISIEIKSGNINKEKLLEYKWSFLKEKQDSTESEHPLKKYNFGFPPLLSIEEWIKILFEGQVSPTELNNSIAQLHYFISKKQPSWVKLWHYGEQEDDDFENLLTNVIDEFNNCKYQRPDILLHVVALLVFFNKWGISNYSIVDIENQMMQSLENCFAFDNYKNKQHYLVEDLSWGNHTGLGYMNSDDENFLELFEKFRSQNKKLYELDEEQRLQNELVQFINKMSNGDMEFVKNFLCKENNEYSPVLSQLNAQDFFDALSKLSNTNLHNLHQIMSSRYSDNKILNGQKYDHHLRDELPLWNELQQKFQECDYSSFTVRKIVLGYFEKGVINRVVEKMTQHGK